MAETVRPAPGPQRRKPPDTLDAGAPWWLRWSRWVVDNPKQASTLGGMLVAALPAPLQFLGAMALGVPYADFWQALRENQLWKDNIACAAAPFDGLAVNQQNVQVDAVVCQSGNVLVRVQPLAGKPAYRWVPLDSMLERTAGAFGLIATAHAQPAPAGPVSVSSNQQVVCQQWLGNGLIRRRIFDRGSNRCYDEVVNTFTGRVVSTTPAPSCNC